MNEQAKNSPNTGAYSLFNEQKSCSLDADTVLDWDDGRVLPTQLQGGQTTGTKGTDAVSPNKTFGDPSP